MQLIERLGQWIEKSGLSINAVEKEAGLSQGTVSKAIRNKGQIGTDKVEKICQAYSDLNPTWLVTGRGQMISQEKDFTVSEPTSTYNKENKPVYIEERLDRMEENIQAIMVSVEKLRLSIIAEEVKEEERGSKKAAG